MTGRGSHVPVDAATRRRLDLLLARDQVTGRLPTAVAGVVRGGELVWTGTHGDSTGGPAPSADLQFRIGSITKTMTAVLVMQLRDEGLLDLNDTVAQHLPGVGYGDRTIRDLLAHSSGMQSEPAGSWWERSRGVDFESLAAGIDDGAAVFRAGQTYHYSNLAFALLGALVARLRGGTWWEQVVARIIEPLAMTRTSYLPEQPAATGYSVHPFAGTLTPEPSQDTGAMAPAGQVWSTVTDLARYAGLLVHGHDRVLTRATAEEMRVPRSGTLSVGVGAGYGLGLRLVAGGSGTLVGHTGSMPGFLAGLFADPLRDTAAVVLCNGTTGLRAEALPIGLLETLEELEPSVPASWKPVDGLPEGIADVIGVWHWGNTAYAFSWDGTEVVVATLADRSVSYRFRPASSDTFLGTEGYHHGETLRVVRDAQGGVSHLECATFVYTRIPYDPRAPIPGAGD